MGLYSKGLSVLTTLGLISGAWPFVHPHPKARCSLKMVRQSSSDSGDPIDRSNLLKRAFASVTAGVGLCSVIQGKPQEAKAWCGKPYPSWAYRLYFNDGNIPLPLPQFGKGTEMFIRVVGDDTEEQKAGVYSIILVPGGPGLAHDYLETLESLVYTKHRIITFDPIGTGQSTKTLPKELGEEGSLEAWSKAMAAQIAYLVNFLEIKDHHVLGHGAGALAALEYVSEVMEKKATDASAPAIKSLTLASPFVLSGPSTITKRYEESKVKVPLCITEAVTGAVGAPGISTDGATLDRNGASSPLLSGIGSNVPVLISYGSDDLVHDSFVQQIIKSLPAGTQTTVKEFKGAGSLAHIDYPEDYANWLDDQLKIIERRTSI